MLVSLPPQIVVLASGIAFGILLVVRGVIIVVVVGVPFCSDRKFTASRRPLFDLFFSCQLLEMHLAALAARVVEFCILLQPLTSHGIQPPVILRIISAGSSSRSRPRIIIRRRRLLHRVAPFRCCGSSLFLACSIQMLFPLYCISPRKVLL